MGGLTVEQTAILLRVKRLEKQATLIKVDLLRVLADMCTAYREQADIDFGRVQEEINLNLAKANSLQDEVNEAREDHGKTVVFSAEHDSDDEDHWDTTAEASSTVGEASSVAGEPSFLMVD